MKVSVTEGLLIVGLFCYIVGLTGVRLWNGF